MSTQGQQYQFGYFQPVYLGAPNQVWAPTKALPTDWTPYQPKSSVHRVSQPPKAPIQLPTQRPPLAPLAFAENKEPQKAEIISPPRFEIQLSDPAFLLEPEPKPQRAEVGNIAPPKLEIKLSDPAFLLETEPVTVQEMQVLEEWVYDGKEMQLDEWVCDGKETESVVVQERSKSTESGSSYASRRREPTLFQMTKTTEHKEVAPRNVAPAPFVQQRKNAVVAKSVPEWSSDRRVRVVERRRRTRKIIEVGETYRTKRAVKVTKEEDPFFYRKVKSSKKSKTRVRDPNEVWTLKKDVALQVIEIRDRRACIFCTVEFWSKHQDRNYDRPRQKKVEGWITLKDGKGWVLM